MKKQEIPSIVILIIGGLIYSITSFAYMHQTFPTKYSFEMFIKKLDRVEMKLDRLISK